MAESVAIPSFQTLVQISKRLQDVSGQFFLRELVVTVPKLLPDPTLVCSVVIDDHVLLGAFKRNGRRVSPSSLATGLNITVTTFVALTRINTPQSSE